MALCKPCDAKFDLGCFDHCSEITGLTSDESGKHVMTYQFGASINTVDIVTTAGVAFSIPNTFNETAQICFSIEKPSGAALEVVDGGNTYTCFRFQNLI